MNDLGVFFTYRISSSVVLHVLCCPRVSGRMVPLQIKVKVKLACKRFTVTRAEEIIVDASSSKRSITNHCFIADDATIGGVCNGCIKLP